ncbi:unnamed protein product, partial [Pylaiella littoralis]
KKLRCVCSPDLAVSHDCKGCAAGKGGGARPPVAAGVVVTYTGRHNLVQLYTRHRPVLLVAQPSRLPLVSQSLFSMASRPRLMVVVVEVPHVKTISMTTIGRCRVCSLQICLTWRESSRKVG